MREFFRCVFFSAGCLLQAFVFLNSLMTFYKSGSEYFCYYPSKGILVNSDQGLSEQVDFLNTADNRMARINALSGVESCYLNLTGETGYFSWDNGTENGNFLKITTISQTQITEYKFSIQNDCEDMVDDYAGISENGIATTSNSSTLNTTCCLDFTYLVFNKVCDLPVNKQNYFLLLIIIVCPLIFLITLIPLCTPKFWYLKLKMKQIFDFIGLQHNELFCFCDELTGLPQEFISGEKYYTLSDGNKFFGPHLERSSIKLVCYNNVYKLSPTHFTSLKDKINEEHKFDDCQYNELYNYIHQVIKRKKSLCLKRKEEKLNHSLSLIEVFCAIKAGKTFETNSCSLEVMLSLDKTQETEYFNNCFTEMRLNNKLIQEPDLNEKFKFLLFYHNKLFFNKLGNYSAYLKALNAEKGFKWTKIPEGVNNSQWKMYTSDLAHIHELETGKNTLSRKSIRKETAVLTSIKQNFDYLWENKEDTDRKIPQKKVLEMFKKDIPVLLMDNKVNDKEEKKKKTGVTKEVGYVKVEEILKPKLTGGRPHKDLILFTKFFSKPPLNPLKERESAGKKHIGEFVSVFNEIVNVYPLTVAKAKYCHLMEKFRWRLDFDFVIEELENSKSYRQISKVLSCYSLESQDVEMVRKISTVSLKKEEIYEEVKKLEGLFIKLFSNPITKNESEIEPLKKEMLNYLINHFFFKPNKKSSAEIEEYGLDRFVENEKETFNKSVEESLAIEESFRNSNDENELIKGPFETFKKILDSQTTLGKSNVGRRKGGRKGRLETLLQKKVVNDFNRSIEGPFNLVKLVVLKSFNKPYGLLKHKVKSSVNRRINSYYNIRKLNGSKKNKNDGREGGAGNGKRTFGSPVFEEQIKEIKLVMSQIKNYEWIELLQKILDLKKARDDYEGHEINKAICVNQNKMFFIQEKIKAREEFSILEE